MPTLWTHSHEAQRRLLLHCTKDLLWLETALRHGKPPLSREDLDMRLLLLSEIIRATRAGEPLPVELAHVEPSSWTAARLARVRDRLERLPPESKNDVDG